MDLSELRKLDKKGCPLGSVRCARDGNCQEPEFCDKFRTSLDALQSDSDQLASNFLKLSDAILIGAAIRPQTRGGVFISEHGSCALGAAYEGSGGFILRGAAVRVMTHLLLKLNFEEANKAFCDKHGYSIVWANDAYRWTREEIAAELRELGY